MFQKNIHILFSLAEKWKNTENLRNQIKNLDNEKWYANFAKFYRSDSTSRALHKALIEGVKELKDQHGMENCWLIVFTSGDNNNWRKKQDKVNIELKNSDANLLIFSFSPTEADGSALKALCALTKEGIYIENPDKSLLALAMTSISCIEIDLPPVIVEQFT